MDPKKITASALAFAALLTSFGCSAKKEDTESSSEPVIINTGIDPQSVVFDWQPLYEQKLADYKKSDAYSINSRFDIRDINSDGIPELILSPNDDPMTVCEIYTYTDGLEKVTDMGAYGDLAFGVRFASKRDFAVSMMVAGTYYDKITQYYSGYDENGNYVHGDREVSPAGVSLRIGIEW